MSSAWLHNVEGGVLLDVLVVPNASQSTITGEHEGRLRVRLAAPPVDGKANKALIQLFAKKFGVPKSSVEVAKGHTGRRKQIRLGGLDADSVLSNLPPFESEDEQ